MQYNEDGWLDQWGRIVDEVNKTDIPLECIKKIVFKLVGGRQKTVNIHTLRRQSLEYEDIEGILTRLFEEYDDSIRDVEFVVDIDSVAKIIQPETDKLLGRL